MQSQIREIFLLMHIFWYEPIRLPENVNMIFVLVLFWSERMTNLHTKWLVSHENSREIFLSDYIFVACIIVVWLFIELHNFRFEELCSVYEYMSTWFISGKFFWN